MQTKHRIGVFGPGICPPDTYELAREVGFLLGREGAIVVCGGLGGVMEAAARGAREAGGLTLGILPGASASEANAYIDIPVVTGMGNARNVINVLTSQAVIAIAGSFGTLSEIALALKCAVPVIGLRTWNVADGGGEALPIRLAADAQEAVREALRAARSVGGKDYA